MSSVIFDDRGTDMFFHEAICQITGGVSDFSFFDPVEAFEHFIDNKENYALVISDLRMPGLNGLEPLKKINTSSPKVRRILTHAYNFEEEQLFQRYMENNVINSTLEKPVTMNRLYERVGDEYHK